jgi:hypothetical protein
VSGVVPEPKRAPATHSALAGLGLLRAEQEPPPLNLLRRIVGWRDDVHAGRVVRSADLEALIEEARTLLAPGVKAPHPGDALDRCFDCMWAGKSSCPHVGVPACDSNQEKNHG